MFDLKIISYPPVTALPCASVWQGYSVEISFMGHVRGAWGDTYHVMFNIQLVCGGLSIYRVMFNKQWSVAASPSKQHSLKHTPRTLPKSEIHGILPPFARSRARDKVVYKAILPLEPPFPSHHVRMSLVFLVRFQRRVFRGSYSAFSLDSSCRRGVGQTVTPSTTTHVEHKRTLPQ